MERERVCKCARELAGERIVRRPSLSCVREGHQASGKPRPGTAESRDTRLMRSCYCVVFTVRVQYVQGEVAVKTVHLPPPNLVKGHQYHAFCSANNPGSMELLEELAAAKAIEVRTTDRLEDLDTCEHMLCDPTAKTWTSGATSEAFADEIRARGNGTNAQAAEAAAAAWAGRDRAATAPAPGIGRGCSSAACPRTRPLWGRCGRSASCPPPAAPAPARRSHPAALAARPTAQAHDERP